MDGAASGTVDEGQRPTAMNAGERIEQVRPWLTLEDGGARSDFHQRSEEHTSELQSLMRISYAVFCLKKKIHMTQIIIKLTLIHIYYFIRLTDYYSPSIKVGQKY